MWLTIYQSPAEDERPDPWAAPTHCPHPARCLRLPLDEPRSFRPPTTRTLMIERYRLLIARQCRCHDFHAHELKI
jgi:hypothetical protein